MRAGTRPTLLNIHPQHLKWCLAYSESSIKVSWMAQWVKNALALSPMQEAQETWVLSLGQEDPLEKGMATHSSILAWWIPWTEEPGVLQSMGLQRVGHYWATIHAYKSSVNIHWLMDWVVPYILGLYKQHKSIKAWKKLLIWS